MFMPRYKPITSKRLKQLERDTSSKKYIEWRDYVLNRDHNQCQYPGCNRTTLLQVHHIKRFRNFTHARYLTLNGITLCKDHHIMVNGAEEHFELQFLKLAESNEKRYKKENENIDI